MRVLLGALATIFLVLLAYVALVAYAWVSESGSSLPEPVAGQSDFSRLTHTKPAATIRPSGDPTRAIQQLQDLVRQTASTTWQNHDCGFASFDGRPHAAGWQSLYRHALRCIAPDRSRHYS